MNRTEQHVVASKVVPWTSRICRSAVASIIGVFALLPSCTLPIVAETGSTVLEPGIERLPAAQVSVTTEDGETLRGVFVSAGDDAPIVLHLLPRYVSAMTGLPGVDGFDETLAALRDVGYSSLVFDYRGVGASSGTTDSDRLPIDARAMWNEALSRSKGRPEDVLIRASSLGTLALASLIGEGIEPRAFVLAAPIDSETIVDHAIRRVLGGFLATALAPFFSDPPVPPLAEALSSVDRPVLVLRGVDDDLWPFEEFVRVRLASAPAVRFHTFDRDHEELVSRFFCFEFTRAESFVVPNLITEEKEFLLRLLDVHHPVGEPSDQVWKGVGQGFTSR